MEKLILIIVLSLNYLISAQINEPSAYQKSTIINNLDSTTRYKKLNAILDVYDMYVPEAIPKIETDIFKQQQDIAHWYLICLDKYNSPNFNNIAHRYIDTIANLNYVFEPENINEQKADAIAMLIKKGDYSRVGFLFEYIDMLKPAVASTPFNVLNLIVENVPEYSEQAKAEFRRIALNSNDDYYAPMSLLFLVDYYGEELIPDLVYIIYNSQLSQMKSIAYDELEKQNYSDMETITKYLFLNEKDYKLKWINNLITKYATPSNYKFIQDNYQNIIVPEWLPAYREYFQQTKLSNPLYPPSFNNLFEQFDYFINLCDSLFNYTWLGDLTFSNELKNILTIAKTNLQNGDSLACRVQVKAFQDLVDNVYKDSLNTDPRFVTIEGWKFLYWNAQYILDRLPEP